MAGCLCRTPARELTTAEHVGSLRLAMLRDTTNFPKQLGACVCDRLFHPLRTRFYHLIPKSLFACRCGLASVYPFPFSTWLNVADLTTEKIGGHFSAVLLSLFARLFLRWDLLLAEESLLEWLDVVSAGVGEVFQQCWLMTRHCMTQPHQSWSYNGSHMWFSLALLINSDGICFIVLWWSFG